MVRVVETQYIAATMRLVDTPEAQAVLEAAIEASKPPVPPDCAHLHYLLSTPFRYPPLPWPSRFRGPLDPGVFYAAERDRTALAELARWRLQVLLDAVDLVELEPVPHTLFSVSIAARTVDVAAVRPFSLREALLHPHNYGPSQQWAREVRAEGLDAIRYPSVRDRPDGVCWAVLSPAAFRSTPRLADTWLIRVTRKGAYCRSTRAASATLHFTADRLLVRSTA